MKILVINIHELLQQRSNNNGGGNPNSYLPQVANPASNYVNNNDIFNKGAQNNNIYEDQFKRLNNNQKNTTSNNTTSNKNFTIKPFNLSDDMN